jgi:DMSO/TMAO reductase YedYZ molybdopterin-dependent catalytic subunit
MKILKWIFPFLAVVFLLAACAGPVPSPVPSQSAAPSESAAPSQSVDSVSQATKDRFRAGEVREYQGKPLSPAVGPRDNSIAGVQQVDISTYRLRVDGLVESPVDMKYEDVLALTPYERLITLYCVEGWSATMLWKGVLLEDIMKKAGVKPEAVTVIFHAVDGYTTSLPLSVIKEKQLILAFMANGIPLPPEMGYPFIVVAEDKLGYKWARWVTRIELSDDPDYRGYWEQRGFTNDANVN